MTILRSDGQRVVAGFEEEVHTDLPETASSRDRPMIDDWAEPKIETAAMIAKCSDMAVLSLA